MPARTWRGTVWLDRLSQDLRDGVRSLTRYPLSAVVGILSLAAGIGATAVTLTIRDAIFRSPPPEYEQPRQLSRIRIVRGTQPAAPIGSVPSGALLGLWLDARETAVSIAAAVPARGARDVRANDHLDSAAVWSATANLFDVLGVKPVIGRSFAASIDAAADAPPALLSYRLWQRWFDGRPDAVGSTIWIESRPHVVVGVLPRRFWFGDMQSPVWTLLTPAMLPTAAGLEVVARRPAGMTPAALDAQLRTGLAAYASQLPTDERQLRLRITSVEGTPMAEQMALALPWVLGTAVLLTLLIACANVAILMIAQWTSREHEIAIRASLGASRRRLIRSLLTESVLVAACGGVLGVAATFVLRDVLLERSGAALDFFDVSIHASVLAQSIVLTLVAGLLTGIAPALLETRRVQGNPLRGSLTTDRIRQRWRHALVVLEISVTVALLVVAAAFVNGYQRALTSNMGFATRPMMSIRLENQGGIDVAAMLETLRSVPGVASAAASTTVPFSASGPRQRVAAEAGSNGVRAERGAVTPAFFQTLGVPIRAGRMFTAADLPATRVAIVNETLARQLFAAESPLGRTIWIEQDAHEIVGVAADFANSPLFLEFSPRVFVPMAATARAATRLNLVVRAQDDPAALVAAVRRRLQDAAAGNVIGGAFTFDQIKTVTGQELLVGTAPLVPLIVIGLLLMTAGIYGVLAFAIARRSRELAVRVAVGASSGDLVRLVAGQSVRLIACGTLFGVALTFALSRVARASGGAGSPFDASWPAFAVPIGIVTVVGALATWLPSRRVRTIDPATLLRSP